MDQGRDPERREHESMSFITLVLFTGVVLLISSTLIELATK